MKKRKVSWSKIVIIVILVLMAVLVGGMYGKLVELTSQIAYLQDTTNIILTDVGGMESTIAQTLKEETGMVESYSIQVTDMNLVAKTYDVSVYLIPREYTDSTTISVFFGTLECPLTKDGYAYTGTITLPITESFDGNLTFLFADGTKKNTEVYSNYEGIQTNLEQVLSGSTESEPSYKEGVLSLKGDVIYSLSGKGQYEFDSLELVAEWNDEEVWTQNLTYIPEEDEGVSPDDVIADVFGQETTEVSEPEVIDQEPIEGLSGDTPMDFTYEPEETGELRLYLRAVSTEGYRFEFDLLHANLIEEDPDNEESKLVLDETSVNYSVSYVVYDKRGGKLVLE